MRNALAAGKKNRRARFHIAERRALNPRRRNIPSRGMLGSGRNLKKPRDVPIIPDPCVSARSYAARFCKRNDDKDSRKHIRCDNPDDYLRLTISDWLQNFRDLRRRDADVDGSRGLFEFWTREDQQPRPKELGELFTNGDRQDCQGTFISSI